jgi:hypothetical protein
MRSNSINVKDCNLKRGIARKGGHTRLNIMRIVNLEKRAASYNKIKSVTTRDSECIRVIKVCTRDNVYKIVKYQPITRKILRTDEKTNMITKRYNA